MRQARSTVSDCLELVLYHNRFQLFTDGALYSDGVRYRPALLAVQHLRDFLPAVTSVLILGAGLGSLVQVLRAEGRHPRCWLVDKDPTVLAWAREVLGESPSLDFVRGDAESFMAQPRRRYDLIFVDVFKGRTVPDFATAPAFIRRCRDSLNPGGRVVLNYIVQDESRWQAARAVFDDAFPGCDTIASADNRIVIGRQS